MKMEYKGWEWLYSVYGVSTVDCAIALYDGGWRPEDREDLIEEYDLTEDEVDSYIDVFERLLKDEEDEKKERPL
jgi:hypothetical protein